MLFYFFFLISESVNSLSKLALAASALQWVCQDLIEGFSFLVCLYYYISKNCHSMQLKYSKIVETYLFTVKVEIFNNYFLTEEECNKRIPNQKIIKQIKILSDQSLHSVNSKGKRVKSNFIS